jgi:hypothetical protein
MPTLYKKPHGAWNVLFFIYVFAVFNGAGIFFPNNSQPQFYYQALAGFSTFFLIHYLLNVLAIMLDIVAIIPFYNFIKPDSMAITKRYFSPDTWKWLFAIRIALLLVGHSYDHKQLQAVLRDDLLISASVLILLAILYAPSYFTNFVFAYRQEKN